MATFSITKIKPAFEDNRGKIFDLLEEPVNHIGLITSKSGSVRANHYHKLSTQYTYVLSGKIELAIKDLNASDAKVEKFVMLPGDLASIPPMVVHRYTALEDSSFLDFTTESRADGGYEKDVYRTNIE